MVARGLVLWNILLVAHVTSAFIARPGLRPFPSAGLVKPATASFEHMVLKATEMEEATSAAGEGQTEDAEGYTSQVEEKGLEFGLFKTFQNKDLPAAGELLKQYGGAYLITSISFAIVSFAICYTLIDSGVDVASLLGKVGLSVAKDSTGDKAGTFALAYAVHKAASPIRFPPTVALTPVVAKVSCPTPA